MVRQHLTILNKTCNFSCKNAKPSHTILLANIVKLFHNYLTKIVIQVLGDLLSCSHNTKFNFSILIVVSNFSLLHITQLLKSCVMQRPNKKQTNTHKA